jgi:hypothetical protein
MWPTWCRRGRQSRQDRADSTGGACGDVAFDWLRSSAQIHLAALQLRLLPVGIDRLGFVAGRPHQRCERRFACDRAAPRAALALAGWSITSVTPAPEVTVNFMARSRVHLDIVGGHRMLQRKPRAEGSFDAGRSSMRLRENKRPEHKFERTARRPSIDTKVEAGERAVSSRPRPPSAWSLRARHSRSSVVGSRRCYRCRS